MAIGYEKLGSGPHRVLALHGWFGDHTAFAPMRDALALGDFTYVCMDYRGYGRSKTMKGDYTIAEIASDALALVDSLGWDRFSLVGHSMGGSAVQRILANAPDRVSKLIGVTPVPASGVPFPPDVWKTFDSAAGNIDVRRGLIDFSTGSRLSKTWLDRMARYSAETSTVEAFGAYLHAWAKTDFSAEIKGKSTPVKVIIGEHDPSLNEDAMKATWLAWYPNAQMEIIRNAGHYPMDEAPVATATSIEAFLRK